MARLFAASLLMAITASAGPLFGQGPKLQYMVPAAAAPGQTVDIRLNGDKLAKPTGFWNNAGITAVIAPGIDKNGTQPGNVTYRMTIPANAELGMYGMRVATGQGVSNLGLFMIDDLPTISEAANNKAIATAQELQLPVAVEGAAETESYDYFKFRAEAGQRLSADVVARRLGSPLDPIIRLLDSAGRELAYSDDEEATGADSRFVHTFQAAGEYFLELRDIRYLGGGAYRYRLRLGDFPLATAPFPLGVQQGSTAKVELTGTKLSKLAPLSVKVPSDATAGQRNLRAEYTRGQGSTTVTLLTGKLPEQIEFEPNNTPETASPIELSGAINGRFEAARDRDYYSFQAKKGQHVLLTGQTRSLGSSSDLFMRLFDAKGAKLAEAEDSGTSDEGLIDYTFPADGVYQLMVEDLLNRGGPDHVYRIELETFQPGFSLSVEADKFDVPQQGVLVIKVTCVRRGYNGPIELSLPGLENDIEPGKPVIIGEGKANVILKATLRDAIKPGELRPFKVVGRAKIGDQQVQATAGSLVALRTTFNGLSNPPATLDGELALGVGPVFADFIKLATEPKEIPFPQLVGKTSFKVTATRLDKFADAVTLALEGLPAGFQAKAVPIEKGKNDVTIDVTGPAALAEGEYTFKLVGTGTHLDQPGRVSQEVVLRVVKPLAVTLAPGGKLTAGGKQKLKVRVTRFGGEKGEVQLRLSQLPRGVSGADKLAIGEGKDELEIELTTAADAPVGPADCLVFATTKIQGREINVTSEPVKLEIAKP